MFRVGTTSQGFRCGTRYFNKRIKEVLPQPTGPESKIPLSISRGFDELSTYAVSKSALEGFMRSASVEYAKDGIQLNCLAPGFVESSYAENFKENRKDLYEWTLAQTPMGRWGKCEEMANIASFMISVQNSYMTGTTIYSDGGWTAK